MKESVAATIGGWSGYGSISRLYRSFRCLPLGSSGFAPHSLTNRATRDREVMNDMKNRTDRNLMVKSFIPNKSMIVAEFIIYYLVTTAGRSYHNFPCISFILRMPFTRSLHPSSLVLNGMRYERKEKGSVRWTVSRRFLSQLLPSVSHLGSYSFGSTSLPSVVPPDEA